MCALPRRPGLTLMELVVVLAVLVALAGIGTLMVSGNAADAKGQATNATMTAIRDAVAAYRIDMKDDVLKQFHDAGAAFRPLVLPRPAYVSSAAANKPNLKYLFFDPGMTALGYRPDVRRGWHGPYLARNGTLVFDHAKFDTSFAAEFADGDIACSDGWGSPIVLREVPGTLPSAVRAELVSAGPDRLLNTADDVTFVIEERTP